MSKGTTKIDNILSKAAKHCDEIIKPSVNQWNKEGVWPRKASDKAAKSGLLGLYCPEEFGGQGLPLGEGIKVYEELGKGDGAYSFALSMHNICAFAICGFGTDSFKKKYAKKFTSGKLLLNFALTEPQSGSDPRTMYTHATVNKDGSYTVTGSKAWVSLATEANYYLTVCKTSNQPGYKDMAMVAIPAEAKGLSFGELYDTPSYKFLPMAEMYMDKVHVPAENVILPIGSAFSGALMAIDIARVSIASGCCGLMEAALDKALRYAKDRKMFQSTNLKLQGIQWALGEVATNLELSRLLYRKAANALGTEEGPLLAAHAKRFVPDAALHAAATCTQVMGGMGLLSKYGMDRLTMLAQMLKIVDGTTEIQRVVIGRSLEKRAETLPPIEIPKGHGEK